MSISSSVDHNILSKQATAVPVGMKRKNVPPIISIPSD